LITVVSGALAAAGTEALLRPIRSDLAPTTAGARDVLLVAGEDVERRLDQMGPLPVGGAFITPGGGLQVSFVIHVVTASPEEGESPVMVQRALRNGLRRAVEWEIQSLAIPPLGIGVGRLDTEDAARAMVEILVNHLNEGQAPLDLTIVVGTGYEQGVFDRIVGELGARANPGENRGN
jgi:O-acetyl-ADP-ribose deacetylase (regulator of RNase III)